jgi:ABC-type xylose transport system substrate-binding protein
MSVKSVIVVASLALGVVIGIVLGRGGDSAGAATPAAGPQPIRIGLSLDTLKEARWAREEGVAGKPVEELARRATELALALAKGRPLVAMASTANGQIDVPSIFHDVVTVTRDNIDDTVFKDGFHPRELVYKGVAAE